jgi:hypothetical protein
MPLQLAGVPPRGGLPPLWPVRQESAQSAAWPEITPGRPQCTAGSGDARLSLHTAVTAGMAELRGARAGGSLSQHLTPGGQRPLGSDDPPHPAAPGTPAISPGGAR